MLYHTRTGHDVLLPGQCQLMAFLISEAGRHDGHQRTTLKLETVIVDQSRYY